MIPNKVIGVSLLAIRKLVTEGKVQVLKCCCNDFRIELPGEVVAHGHRMCQGKHHQWRLYDIFSCDAPDSWVFKYVSASDIRGSARVTLDVLQVLISAVTGWTVLKMLSLFSQGRAKITYQGGDLSCFGNVINLDPFQETMFRLAKLPSALQRHLIEFI